MASTHADDEPDSSPTETTTYSIDSLYEENERLRKDLEDCRDQLFQLLQKGNDTPENDIKHAFHMIYSGVDSWIDEVSCEDTLGESFKAQFKRKVQSKSSLASLGLHPQCSSDSVWLVDHLGRLRDSLRIVVSLVISHFLTNEIFRQEKTEKKWGNLYPHAMDEVSIEEIVEMQGKMKDELQRGDSEVSKWRGQTVSVLLAFDKAKLRARQESQRHLSELRRRLEDWLGEYISESLSASLMGNVILRANKALDMVCCSSKTYIIGSPLIPPGPADEQVGHFHIKDMISWKSTPSRRVVDLLQCLYPGVMRIGESGQDDLLLVQPMWLGYEERGHLPRASQPSPAVRPSSEKKHSKRQGDSAKSQSAIKSMWTSISWGYGVTRSGKAIPKTVAVVEPLLRRGTQPGPQQGPGDHSNLHEQYAYRTSGSQLSAYGGHGHHNRPDTNGEGSSGDYGRDFRRSSTR